MSISSEISRISGNVSDSLAAVAAKGVTVPTGSNSDDLPTLIAQIQSGGGDGDNPTFETEWVDVYSDWQAGYFYDPEDDYAYTQISSTETIWGQELRINVSCTPYTSLIPVKSGESWRYNNLPVYIDSRADVIPSIIIFDSNKAEIESYTRTYQDEYTEFTIPTGGVWMAVLYYNNQTYVLQKKVAKRFDKDELLASVEADYRSYSMTSAPTQKTFTKGYICLGTDDIRPDQIKSLHTLFTSNNIPYYIGAIPESAKKCVTDDPYKTNIDYMRLCVAAGGEIVCHSDAWITEQNKHDFDVMYKYFCKGKEELESYGFDIRGIFKAGGENAIYDVADPAIDMWAVHYFEYGDDFTTAIPYKTGRTILEDWQDYSGLGNMIRDVVDNHTYLIGVVHKYDQSVQTAFTNILSALSDYTEGVDYEFVTPSELYELMMPTTRPSGGGGSSITYSLSMSSNVITLTGSNGSTSSVTLPVYSGGVT